MAASGTPTAGTTNSAVFIGTESLLTECAQLWLDDGHSIEFVCSPQPEISAWCDQHDIRFVALDQLDTAVRGVDVDYLFSVINFRLLSDDILGNARIAAINFHDAPLPAYGGRNAAAWSLINGERSHSVCWHRMTGDPDAGAILAIADVPVSSNETSFSLNLKCFHAGLASFRQLLSKESMTSAVGPPIDETPRLFLSKDKPANGCVLAFDSSADSIVNLVRALDFGPGPNPIGLTKLATNGSWIHVGSAAVGETSPHPSGYIASADRSGITVVAEGRDVILTGLRNQWGDALDADEGLRQLGLSVGERIESPPGVDDTTLASVLSRLARFEPYWSGVLRDGAPLGLPIPRPPESGTGRTEVAVSGCDGLPSASSIAAAWVCFLARLAGKWHFHVRVQRDMPELLDVVRAGFVEQSPPTEIEIDADESFEKNVAEVERQLTGQLETKTFAADLYLRDGVSRELRAALDQVGVSLCRSTPPDTDLCLITNPDDGVVRVSTNNANVEPAIASILAESFAAFLTSSDSTASVRGCDVVSQEQLTELKRIGRRRDQTAPPSTPLHETFIAQAQRTPDAIALVCGDETASYAELDDLSARIAGFLAANGGSNTIVGVYAERGIEMVAALLGILRAGSAYLPLDPLFPRDRLLYMLEDSGAHTILVSRGQESELASDATQAVEISTAAGHTPINQPIPASDLAYVIYTSGSTGHPKGVQLPHSSVSNFLASMCREPGIDASDRLLAVTTISFDISVLELFGPLRVGATVIIADRATASDGRPLRQLLEGSDATIMQATPVTWRMLIEEGWEGDDTLKSLCGGEALPPDLADALLERSGQLWNMYGPTETTVWSTCKRISRDDDTITIGSPIENTDVYILNEDLKPQPPLLPGEIVIGGAGVALGYLNLEDKTRAQFVPDPFGGADSDRLYRTGDLGRWRMDNELEHLGRQDSQVKIRGYRIELGEIQALLNSQESVRQSALKVWNANTSDAVLAAYVVTEPDQTTSSVQLRKALRRSLPDYMVPQIFVPLDALPQTANGKIDVKALPKPSFADSDAEIVPVETPTETKVAGIWSEVLGNRNISRDANFFLIGGNSLRAIRAAHAMEAEFDGSIELNWLVNENLETIASAIDARATADSDESASGLFSRLKDASQRLFN